MPRKKIEEPENEVMQTMDENGGEPTETIESTNEETAVVDEKSTELEQEPEPERPSAEEPTGADETQSDPDEKDDKNVRRLELDTLRIKREDEDELPIQDDQEVTWNELINAYRTRRFIPVTVSGLEKTQLDGSVVVGYYKDQRILIPVTEMMIYLGDESRFPGVPLESRLEMVCNSMLGAEIDVMIKGMDKQFASVVASRKDAVLRKRRQFYLTPLSDGLPQVREGRIVESRIIGVTRQIARVEIFGVETTLSVNQLSWDWLSSVADKFHVGDPLNVIITKVTGDKEDNLRVEADARSITPNTSMENVSKCKVQSTYIGEVTNVRNGVVFLRLRIGVNAIAHTNYDRRAPGKGDVVSFVVTRINPQYGNVAGIIARIIKQNI